MTTTRRLIAAVLTAGALTLATPGMAQARPVPEDQMDTSYTGPTGTRHAPKVKPVQCSRWLIGYSCRVPAPAFALLLRFL